MTRWCCTIVLGLLLAGLGASVARADGLPVPVDAAGPDGVAAPDGGARYVTLAAGPGTVVARVEQDGGRVTGSAFLRGRFAVPVVALDGSSAGLSADGRTLVLVRPRLSFPRAQTTFVSLDANRLRPIQPFTLRGDFSFDALSPDGKTLYLIEYVAPSDPNRYVVRAYDLSAGRLLPDPIVDPREPDEAMRGLPITRATSPDGRWAYTLYDGAGAHPFVHALDTSGRTAACIDLDVLAGRDDLYDLRLDVPVDGGTVSVLGAGGPVVIVDTTTFEVREPGLPAAARTAPPEPPRQPAPAALSPSQQTAAPGGTSWRLVSAAAGAAVLVAAAALGLTLRRRRAGLLGGS
jgi:hypothetical protein